MQRARLIVLLVVISIFVLSLPSMAQLAQGNWPRPGRDYYNSGLSPATVIAKPVLKWTAATPARDFTFDGIQIDPAGNIYTGNDYEFYVRKYSSAGTQLWQTSVSSHNMYYMYYGLAIYDDGTNQYLIAGPQQKYTSYWTGEPSMYAINPSTGGQVWRSPEFTAYVGTGHEGGSIGPTSNVSPAIGYDGTIYTGNCRTSFYDPTGALHAINPADGSIKWTYTGIGQGDTYGSAAIKQVEGKNVIYTASGVYQQDSIGAYTGVPRPNILAIQDDGTSASLLWSANIGFTTSQPILSADGETVYVAGRESQPAMYNNTFTPYNIGLPNFIALDAATGTVKWSLVTGSRHAFSPTLGPDGTIYVCGGYFRTGNQSTSTPDVDPTACPGKLIAVKDNGTSGEIKWTLPLPDDETSDTTRVAVISTTPTTMYVATGCGRVYCVQDMGTYPKIVWTWQAFSTRYCGVYSHGYTPANIAIADDGTVYTGWGQNLFAFETGFNPSSPEGISGTVKDSNGNPIADAWVAASTSPNPLADNAHHIWTKSNADGTYQISPKDANTYYVAACAEGYEGSADQTAAFATTSTKVTGVDFVLGPAKYNCAIGSVATATSEDTTYTANYACDGNLSTRYASTSTTSDLVIDLGADKSISEAVIYWWFNYGKAYTLQYSTDNTTWNTAYTTTTGNGGFPLEFYPCDPTVAIRTGGNCNYSGGPKTGADVIKFSAITARYWKVSFTSATNFYGDSLYKTGPSVFGSTATYASIWEVELRDSTRVGEVPATIGDAKAAQDGDGVMLDGLYVTAVGGGVPADTLFVESADRTAGIKVIKSGLSGISFADKVAVTGRIYTDSNGDKYINAATLTRVTTTSDPDGPALEEMSMNNKAAGDSVSQGLFIKTWGKVSDSTTGSFKISDGSATPIKVLCGTSYTMPADDDYIRVRGAVGKDADGPVLYMRDERADWAYDSDDMHALPFTGTYDYPIQYLVLGPFTTDPAPTNAYDLIDEDFITGGETSIGTTIMPAEGLVTDGKTWFVATAADGKLDINAAFGATTETSVAYVHLYVWSETEAPDVSIVTGSDDWLTVYVNGAWQYTIDEGTYPTGRGCVIGEDSPAAITLHQGLNSILFKVINGGSGFGVSSQIIDGAPYGGTGYGGYTPYVTTGLGYSLNPAQ